MNEGPGCIHVTPNESDDPPISPEAVVDVVGELVRSVQALLAACAKASRLNHSDYVALLGLVARDGGMGAGELRNLLGMTTSSATELADRLEKRRLISRVRQSSDRRRVVLTPTGRGRRQIERTLGPVWARVRGIAAGLSEAELGSVGRFLQEVSLGMSDFAPQAVSRRR